ncbi:site-specific integrase [Bradyrhizobium tunisiense]|uniref:site-specific integrase n=1 Tax=Bradyrhizobium tunisiense TaxID=3278709 RepID=UPI0035E18E4E
MSVYMKARSPYWQIDFQIDGVRYAFSSETTSQAEAERIEARAKQEASKRSVPARGRLDCTFDEAAFFYWEHQGKATRGAKALMGNMRRTVLMVGASTMCSTIDFAKMMGYRSELRDGLPSVERMGKNGRKPKSPDGKFSARNINKYLGLVFTILNHAELVLKTNFPDKPRPSYGEDSDQHIFEIVRPRARYLKKEEEDRLEATSEPDLQDMWKADLELGLRESNLCELRWEDVDFTERTVTVELKAEGSSPLMHSVDISDAALKILKRRIGIHPEFVFTLPCRANYSFEGQMREKGQHIPVSPGLFYLRMKKAWTEAGMDLIVHDFRRTAARRKYFDKDIYAAQIFLGHRDIKTTVDYIGLDAVAMGRALRARPKGRRAA